MASGCTLLVVKARAFVGVVAVASALVVGCSLLTSLDGLSGGSEVDGGKSSEGGGGGAETGTTDGAAGDGASDGTAATSTFILAAGGATPDVYESDVYVSRVAADGSLGTWVTAASLPGPRSKAALAVSGSRLFLTGGDAPSVGLTDTTFTTTFGADTVSSWASTTKLPSVLFRHGSFEYLGDVYLVGGSDPSVRTAVLRATPAADGTLGSFRPELSLPTPRASAGVVRSNDHVYVIAGEEPPPGGGTTVATAGAWVGPLDSAGSVTEWRSVAPLPFTTIQPGIAATASHVYVSGGYASTSFTSVVSAPIAADGSLASWTAVSPTLIGRAGHRMVATGGHLYVVGGTDTGGVATASVEVADILADGTLGAFRQTTPLPAARAFMVVTAIDR